MRTVLLCILAAGVYAPPAQSWQQERATYPVQLSSRLETSSQADLKRRLSAPFKEGTAYPAGAKNCAHLLSKYRNEILEAAGPDKQAEKSTLTDCLILQTLAGARVARLSQVADMAWDKGVMPLLPPELAIHLSEEAVRGAQAADARGEGWADTDKSATANAEEVDQIVVKGNGFEERLILWGRGDFNGDGVQDLLVQTLDTLTEGAYRNTRVFVLTRKSAGAKLALVRQLL